MGINKDNIAKTKILALRGFQNLATLLGFYIGEKGNNFQALLGGKWPDTETTRRVAEYDPNRKVLVLVWFGGNNGDFLIQGISIPQLPPPLCYQRLLPRLNEFIVSPGISEKT